MSCSSSLDGFFFKKDLQKWSYLHELVDDENEVIDREEWGGWQTLKSLRMIHLHMFEASNNRSITMAIQKACQLIASNQTHLQQRVTIVSDSKMVVSWIQDDQFGSLVHIDLVYDIRNYLQVYEGLRIQFSSRDSNSFADGLAKLGSNSGADRLE